MKEEEEENCLIFRSHGSSFLHLVILLMVYIVSCPYHRHRSRQIMNDVT